MLAMSLTNQRALDVDQKAIQRINFTGSLALGPTILFITEEAQETVLGFS